MTLVINTIDTAAIDTKLDVVEPKYDNAGISFVTLDNLNFINLAAENLEKQYALRIEHPSINNSIYAATGGKRYQTEYNKPPLNLATISETLSYPSGNRANHGPAKRFNYNTRKANDKTTPLYAGGLDPTMSFLTIDDTVRPVEINSEYKGFYFFADLLSNNVTTNPGLATAVGLYTVVTVEDITDPILVLADGNALVGTKYVYHGKAGTILSVTAALASNPAYATAGTAYIPRQKIHVIYDNVSKPYLFTNTVVLDFSATPISASPAVHDFMSWNNFATFSIKGQRLQIYDFNNATHAGGTLNNPLNDGGSGTTGYNGIGLTTPLDINYEGTTTALKNVTANATGTQLERYKYYLSTLATTPEKNGYLLVMPMKYEGVPYPSKAGALFSNDIGGTSVVSNALIIPTTSTTLGGAVLYGGVVYRKSSDVVNLVPSTTYYYTNVYQTTAEIAATSRLPVIHTAITDATSYPIDVKNAFTLGNYDAIVYVYTPLDYTEKVLLVYGTGGNVYCLTGLGTTFNYKGTSHTATPGAWLASYNAAHGTSYRYAIEISTPEDPYEDIKNNTESLIIGKFARKSLDTTLNYRFFLYETVENAGVYSWQNVKDMDSTNQNPGEKYYTVIDGGNTYTVRTTTSGNDSLTGPVLYHSSAGSATTITFLNATYTSIPENTNIVSFAKFYTSPTADDFIFVIPEQNLEGDYVVVDKTLVRSDLNYEQAFNVYVRYNATLLNGKINFNKSKPFFSTMDVSTPGGYPDLSFTLIDRNFLLSSTTNTITITDLLSVADTTTTTGAFLFTSDPNFTGYDSYDIVYELPLFAFKGTDTVTNLLGSDGVTAGSYINTLKIISDSTPANHGLYVNPNFDTRTTQSTDLPVSFTFKEKNYTSAKLISTAFPNYDFSTGDLNTEYDFLLVVPADDPLGILLNVDDLATVTTSGFNVDIIEYLKTKSGFDNTIDPGTGADVDTTLNETGTFSISVVRGVPIELATGLSGPTMRITSANLITNGVSAVQKFLDKTTSNQTEFYFGNTGSTTAKLQITTASGQVDAMGNPYYRIYLTIPRTVRKIVIDNINVSLDMPNVTGITEAVTTDLTPPLPP